MDAYGTTCDELKTAGAVFTYKGITFHPLGKVPTHEEDEVVAHTCLFDLTPKGWNYEDFFQAATVRTDLYELPELGNLVVIPGGSELYAYDNEDTRRNPTTRQLLQCNFVINYRHTTGLYVAGHTADASGLALRFGHIGQAKIFETGKDAERYLFELPPFLYQCGFTARSTSLKERLQHVVLSNEGFLHPNVRRPA